MKDAFITSMGFATNSTYPQRPKPIMKYEIFFSIDAGLGGLIYLARMVK
jgi:hypothetical protein